MADRWAVVGLLQDSLPYREISKQTGVSVTTIGRVARYLVSGNGGYNLVTARLNGHKESLRKDTPRKDTQRQEQKVG